MSKSRQPAGIPSGGQFAPGSRSRAHLSLVPEPPPEHLEAEEATGPDPVTDASSEPTQPSDTTTVTTDGQYTTVTGSKYTGYRPATEVAKDVRADIKAAVTAGHLPSTYTYSVTSRHGALDITVKGMSFDEIHGLLKPNGMRSRRYTQPTRDIVDKLKGIGQAYDKSTSDPYTDYHHGNHYTFVTVEDPATAAFWRSDTARKNAQKTLKDVAADLAPVTAKTGMPTRELLTADLAAEPRLAQLTPNERFAVLTGQEKARHARDAHSQAKEHYEALRRSEDRWDDDDLYR